MFATEDTAAIEQETWRVDARCADSSSALVDLFFSEQIDDILRAKAFCLECPVRQPCLDGAVARRGACGVASSSRTGRFWPRSAGAGVHRRCGRPNR